MQNFNLGGLTNVAALVKKCLTQGRVSQKDE